VGITLDADRQYNVSAKVTAESNHIMWDAQYALLELHSMVYMIDRLVDRDKI